MEIVVEYLQQVSWEDIIGSTIRILLILTMGWIAMSVVGRFSRRVEAKLLEGTAAPDEPPTEAAKRIETVVRLLRQVVLIFLWLSVLLVVLNQMGVQIGPIIASLGVVGLAVGFGAQNLVRDVIAGFFFIVENQVRVGDVAIVNGTGGLVESVNFRTLVLRDLAGTVHIFPNGTVTTLSNMTREWSAYVFDIGVAYKENVDRVMDLIREVGAELKADAYFGAAILDELEVFGVNKFADSAVEIKGRLKTKPIKQWEVGREFLRRVKHRFDAEGVEIPFPHRSLYIGEASKPVAVELLEGLQRGK